MFRNIQQSNYCPPVLLFVDRFSVSFTCYLVIKEKGIKCGKKERIINMVRIMLIPNNNKQ